MTKVYRSNVAPSTGLGHASQPVQFCLQG